MVIDVAILGAGESGVGAALLAKKKGLSVFVSDLSGIKDSYKKELNEAYIRYEEKKHSEDIILSAALVVKSPGIPDNVPLIKKIKAHNINIISEIEFAAKYTKAKFVCVTGSNGKTTTTLLIHHLLKQTDLNIGLAGNIGYSLARQVALDDFVDWYVVELSSFQLDGMLDFKADIAVLMNITPDHLDRYDNKMQNYINSKFRVVQNQTEKDYFIYCDDDKVILDNLENRDVKAKCLPFSYQHKVNNGAYYKNANLSYHCGDIELDVEISNLIIKGQHNHYNAMAAGIVASVLGLSDSQIQEGLATFEAVEHRLEYVSSVKGVMYINDSKATNADSTWYALSGIDAPIVWIAGGVDKGNNYSEIKKVVRDKVKLLICLGIDNEKLKETFEDAIPQIEEARSMEEAVRLADLFAKKGDAVLLSPACASFDLFNNYEQRGCMFKESVTNLDCK